MVFRHQHVKLKEILRLPRKPVASTQSRSKNGYLVMTEVLMLTEQRTSRMEEQQ